MSIYIPARVVRMKSDETEQTIIQSDIGLPVKEYLIAKSQQASKVLSTRLDNMKQSPDLKSIGSIESATKKLDAYEALVEFYNKASHEIGIGKGYMKSMRSPYLNLTLVVGKEG